MKNLLILSVLAFSAQIVTAQTIVYDNEFTSTGLDNTGSGWSLPGGGVYNNTIGANVITYATTQVAAAAGVDFSMTSTFNFGVAPLGSGTTLGFAALADSATLADDYLLADLNPSTGVFRLFSIGGAGLINSATFSSSIGVLPDYTLTLAGVYDGADLDLTLTLDNGTTSQYISGTLAAADLASMGDYFGYRHRTATGGSLNVDYDNLTISAVPEPGTFALLAGCLALSAVMVRRRK
ncbi:PEP-CTERM sorting domain-containing protein [Puniceicoccus vermicola]|uniref:PEP-CTERM sorting domain-containing protein n=1 Tax=Puniceicoccus vermicola TaxID=388746 RepID=A0A7X1AZF6_9BACT|nr:PEP-CTERM sorting domain-containing protein [Puniceicoccus vermicola]MBC2602787.1 PEP-CTERM sorting domain-containing protein [Puniceicoccus vermicola]